MTGTDEAEGLRSTKNGFLGEALLLSVKGFLTFLPLGGL
jgi:hypothetical protein